MDKKALLPCPQNYPQVPPQAERPIYRGFQVHKLLLNHADKVFFHQIWLYHHHHALDLYPDLEARLAPIRPRSGLWTEASAEAGSIAQLLAIIGLCPARAGRRRTGGRSGNQALDQTLQDSPRSSNPDVNARDERSWKASDVQRTGRWSDVIQVKTSSRCSTWNQKKKPGIFPGLVRFHVEQRCCQRRSGITT